jgi:hypothetical protein
MFSPSELRNEDLPKLRFLTPTFPRSIVTPSSGRTLWNAILITFVRTCTALRTHIYNHAEQILLVALLIALCCCNWSFFGRFGRSCCIDIRSLKIVSLSTWMYALSHEGGVITSVRNVGNNVNLLLRYWDLEICFLAPYESVMQQPSTCFAPTFLFTWCFVSLIRNVMSDLSLWHVLEVALYLKLRFFVYNAGYTQRDRN